MIQNIAVDDAEESCTSFAMAVLVDVGVCGGSDPVSCACIHTHQRMVSQYCQNLEIFDVGNQNSDGSCISNDGVQTGVVVGATMDGR